jgi:hypothetical protein
MLVIAFNAFKWINILENSTVPSCQIQTTTFYTSPYELQMQLFNNPKLYVHFRSSQLFSPNNFVKGSNNSPEKLKWQPGLYKNILVGP